MTKATNKEIHTAIHCSTESGDDYLWCVAGKLDAKQVKNFLDDQMGEEAEYICSTSFKHTGESGQI
jgi:hypothetical protein